MELSAISQRFLQAPHHRRSLGQLFEACTLGEAGEFAVDHDELAIPREHELAVFDLHIRDASMRCGEAEGRTGEQVLDGVGELVAVLVAPLSFEFF